MMNLKADILIERLSQLADGETYFEIKIEINAAILDIFAKVSDKLFFFFLKFKIIFFSVCVWNGF